MQGRGGPLTGEGSSTILIFLKCMLKPFSTVTQEDSGCLFTGIFSCSEVLKTIRANILVSFLMALSIAFIFKVIPTRKTFFCSFLSFS